MPTIQFDDQVNTTARRKVQGSGMTGLLMRLGIVKTQRGANLVLIAFIVIGMAISIVLLNQSLGPTSVPNNSPIVN